MVSQALNRWRHVDIRRCLRRWNMNALSSELLNTQREMTETSNYRTLLASKYHALLKFLTLYVTSCLKGLINIRISALVNIWARR